MDGPKITTTRWDAADYIETPEDVIEFLKAALEENDPALLTEALKAVSRSTGMATLAQRVGRSHEIFFPESADSQTELTTLINIMSSMNFRLDVREMPASSEDLASPLP